MMNSLNSCLYVFNILTMWTSGMCLSSALWDTLLHDHPPLPEYTQFLSQGRLKGVETASYVSWNFGIPLVSNKETCVWQTIWKSLASEARNKTNTLNLRAQRQGAESREMPSTADNHRRAAALRDLPAVLAANDQIFLLELSVPFVLCIMALFLPLWTLLLSGILCFCCPHPHPKDFHVFPTMSHGIHFFLPLCLKYSSPKIQLK